MTNKSKPDLTPDEEGKVDSAYASLSQALHTSFVILKVSMAVVIVSFIFSGCFIVENYQEAVIYRLGKFVRVVDSGIHFAWPRPFDSVDRCETGRVRSLAVDGFWYREAADKARSVVPEQLAPGTDGYLITADNNMAHAKLTVHYKIRDVKQRVHRVGDEKALIQVCAKSALTRAGASMGIDDMLKSRKIFLKDEVERLLRADMTDLETGIQVVRVDVEPVVPRQVKAEFDKVIQSEQSRSEAIAKAKGAAKQMDNRTRGESRQILSQARAYGAIQLSRAKSDARYLSTIIEKYKGNPEGLALFVKDTHFFRIRRVLENTKAKFFLPKDNGQGNELRLHLNNDPGLMKKGVVQ